MAVRRIGVVTSGGDAPGMNPAIRAVTRVALAKGWEVTGIRHGFSGLIEKDFLDLNARSVGGIINQGGTILGSARCLPFREEPVRQACIDDLAMRKIDGLVVIGGDGSQQGAHALSKMGYPVVGVASTIDNDLYGSDITIGSNTALNIAIETIDRLKVTASSHNRAFLVQVMGRNCGYLALMAAIAGGAESVVIPEVETTPEQVAADIREAYARGKSHAIVVVAEGAAYDAAKLTAYFHEHQARLGYDLRATVLGHVQRGGAPGAFDRLLATRLGAAAVENLDRGIHGVLTGQRDGIITTTPLEEVVSTRKPLDLSLLDLARALAH